MRLTTFGENPSTEEEILADPNAIIALDPVVSKLVVNPQSDLRF
ncbi:MAG: hypothetical protein AAGE84_29140 [Cyanobacteria bacterium P01_G01_bin.39]